VTVTPFAALTDPDAALAAHARMPAGERHNLLTDDPETKDEIRAEIQRQRVRDAHRRARIRAMQEANAAAAREQHGLPREPSKTVWRRT
jgi:hypothetical protein